MKNEKKYQLRHHKEKRGPSAEKYFQQRLNTSMAETQ